MMGNFKLFVYGLWVGAFFLAITVLGDAVVPGQLADTVFSPLGVIITFALLALDTMFSLGSAEER